MPNIFNENHKIFDEEVTVHLARKIFGDPVKCCLEASKKKIKCPNFDTEDHKYNRRVDNALDEVRDVCEMLNMGPIFINSYTITALWKKYFSQSGYMKYHIESWYINIIRLEDMFLILINELFQLGIKKELVGYELVSTNENVPEPIRKNIKKFHKAIKPIRAARIMLIHHQTLYEKKLHEIRTNEQLVKLVKSSKKEKDDEIAKSLRITEFFVKKFLATRYRKEKRNYMLETNKSLLKFISDMFKELEDYYVPAHARLVKKRPKQKAPTKPH